MTDDMDVQIYSDITVSLRTATCDTNGCPAKGEPVQVIVADDTTPIVICGSCGQLITNIQETL